MGIFDDIFGTKETGALNSATGAANGLINSTALGTNADLVNSAANATQQQQLGAGKATTALNTGYGAATGALSNYANKAQGTLGSGVNSAVGTIEGSNSNYAPYAASGTASNGLLADALGVNGASGNAAATAAFQGSPGYQYQLDQTTGAAQRAAAAAGMDASGNTLQAVSQLGSNLANQNYSTWLQNLQGLGTQGLQAAQGISGNNQSAGSAELTGGTVGAQLNQQTGSGLGSLDAAQGTGNATIQSNLGNSLAGIQTGLGNSLTNNAWNATGAIDNNSLALAKAQDSAANANAGIFSKLFGQGANAVLSSSFL